MRRSGKKENRMKPKAIFAGLMAAIVVGGSLLIPAGASAQSLDDLSHRRQKTKNEWRNLAIGGGALTAFGLLKHDTTLTFVGAAGTLYSLDRYEKDRKSQSKIDHARAAAFSRTSFYRNGHRYHRRTVTRNGKRFYQFVRE
jgi:hypothetical protein